ncbi:hypothetical protein [Amycolatopsis sp. cmx-4-61]|uniref:hypothetical protein n=1 Tax=Amycolatopsis sp. cmx-4-61 TaxID=2790937 RepID=UPI00397D0BB8
MVKKAGFLVAGVAAGAFLAGGVASADTPPGHHHGGGFGSQAGLLNLNNTDLLHNVNVTPGVCGLEVNVLIVQVPIQDSLNGIGVPILSPSQGDAGDEDGGSDGHGAAGASPYNCASGSIADGGSGSGN